MNKEIYDKLGYQVERKDDIREAEQVAYFKSLEENSKKLYNKVWSKILKEYKYSEDKSINIPIEVGVSNVYNSFYDVTVQRVNSINGKELFNKFFFTKSIFEQLIAEDFKAGENFTASKTEEDKYIYKIVAKEADLRNMLIKNANEYDNDEITRSYKSTKVRGKQSSFFVYKNNYYK